MTAQTETFTISDLDGFDQAFPALGELNEEINKILLRRDRRIRRIEQGYAVQLLPLLAQIQALYDAMRAFADEHRDELVARGKKFAERPLGRVSWRSNPHIETDLPDDQILEHLWRLDGTAKDLFIRTVTSHELDRAAMLKPENRELAESVQGVRVAREDDFYVQAVGMAKPFVSSRPLWPFPAELDGRELESNDREGVVNILRAALSALEPAQ
jgi:phage host-nuclease inhibitor protein Gam